MYDLFLRQILFTGVLQQIRLLQKTGKPLIPRLPFHRLCCEICINSVEWWDSDGMHHTGAELRWAVDALAALQESAEMFLVDYFERSYLCALHARRMTLQCKDLQLTKRMWRSCWSNVKLYTTKTKQAARKPPKKRKTSVKDQEKQ